MAAAPADSGDVKTGAAPAEAPESLEKTDQFGFLLSKEGTEKVYLQEGQRQQNSSRHQKEVRRSAWLQNKRLEKWRKMDKEWRLWMTKRHAKVKSRIRKGIPDPFRGRMWYVLSGADELRKKSQKSYRNVVDELEPIILQVKTAIEAEREKQKEAARAAAAAADSAAQKMQSSSISPRSTSEKLPEWQRDMHKWDVVIDADLSRTFPAHCMFQRGGFGRTNLQKVLRAYGFSHPKIGYCQGMK